VGGPAGWTSSTRGRLGLGLYYYRWHHEHEGCGAREPRSLGLPRIAASQRRRRQPAASSVQISAVASCMLPAQPLRLVYGRPRARGRASWLAAAPSRAPSRSRARRRRSGKPRERARAKPAVLLNRSIGILAGAYGIRLRRLAIPSACAGYEYSLYEYSLCSIRTLVPAMVHAPVLGWKYSRTSQPPCGHGLESRPVAPRTSTHAQCACP
jgi:hypothetical protein